MIRALSQGRTAVKSRNYVLNRGRICSLLMQERGSLLQKRSGRPRRRRLPGLLLAAAVIGQGLAQIPAAAAGSGPLLAAVRAPGLSQGGGPSRAALAAQADLYRLGPGDGLSLSFLDPSASMVSGAVTILADGTATLALLGSVQLTGLTIGQARVWLRDLYGEYLLRPDLTLSLVTPRPVKVTVLGEVEKPGLYSLATISATPVSAIQAAGGITLNADVRKVSLQRQPLARSGRVADSQLNLGALLQSGDQRQNPLLFDGDTLVVGRIDKPVPEEIFALGASNLRPSTVSINVVGEVKAPGRLALPANITLSEAILAAGGTTPWRAKTNDIELVRMNRDGTSTREIFTLNYSKGVSNAYNPPLKEGDTVIVNRSVYGAGMDAINQVLAPLTSVGNLYYLYRNYSRY